MTRVWCSSFLSSSVSLLQLVLFLFLSYNNLPCLNSIYDYAPPPQTIANIPLTPLSDYIRHNPVFSSLSFIRQITTILSTSNFEYSTSTEVPFPFPVSPWSTSRIFTNVTMHQLLLSNPSTPKTQIFNQFIHKFSSFPHYYTDASKSDSNTGCSVIHPNGDITRFSLPSPFSVFSAELYNVFLATVSAITEPHNSICIFSDSLQAINSFSNLSTISYPLVSSILSTLNQNPFLTIHLLWIPSHSGIPLNEHADVAAKEASLQFFTPDIPIPSCDLISSYSKSLSLIWQSTLPIHFFTAPLRQFATQSSRFSTHLTRHEEVIFNRLLISHTAIIHSYLFTGGPPPICRPPCSSVITVDHLLIECPLLQSFRTASSLSNSKLDILSTNPTSLKKLFHFLKSANIFQLF
ncbi:hypothetical protein PGB90_002975 [Kerria lacca]